MNKMLGILLIFGILISVSYAVECNNNFCCEGEDSGYKYWTRDCADTEKDPSLVGKYCASGTWYDYAVKCKCPSGYTMDTSDNEDGECVESGSPAPVEEEVEEAIVEETAPVETTQETTTTTQETTVDTSNNDLDEYYRYSPVNAIDEGKGGEGCGLSTIILAGVLGMLAIAYKH